MMCLRVILLFRRGRLDGRRMAWQPKAVSCSWRRVLQVHWPSWAKLSVTELHEGPLAASYLIEKKKKRWNASTNYLADQHEGMSSCSCAETKKSTLTSS